MKPHSPRQPPLAYTRDGPHHYVVDEGPARSAATRCSACRALIAFVSTAGGKPLPLDLDKAERLAGARLKCVAHFATCPDAARFSRSSGRTSSEELDQCPVRGCVERKQRGRLMCSSCWRAVDARVGREVRRTFDELKKPKRTNEALRAAREDYRAAAKAAIAQAEGVIEGRARRQGDLFGGSGSGVDPG